MVVTKIAKHPGSRWVPGRWTAVPAGVVAGALILGAPGIASAQGSVPPGHHGPAGKGHDGHGPAGARRGERSIEGTVVSLGTSGTSGTSGGFTISAGRDGLLQLAVEVSTGTTFHERGATSAVSIASVAVGDRVEVQGSFKAADTIDATSVRIVFDGTVRFEGTVSALSSSSSSNTGVTGVTGDFTLSRGRHGMLSVTVDVGSTTTYTELGTEGRPVSVPANQSTSSTATAAVDFASLADGDRVVVRGKVTSANTLLATSVAILPARGLHPLES